MSSSASIGNYFPLKSIVFLFVFKVKIWQLTGYFFCKFYTNELTVVRDSVTAKTQ